MLCTSDACAVRTPPLRSFFTSAAAPSAAASVAVVASGFTPAASLSTVGCGSEAEAVAVAEAEERAA
jgi:hypothetical protein